MSGRDLDAALYPSIYSREAVPLVPYIIERAEQGDYSFAINFVQLMQASRSDMADGASTLRIVTPQKSYSARLDWSVDDFVSLRASPDGSSLDVHMASTRDRRRVPEARVTQAPPGAAVAPVAEGPLPEPVAVPPGH